LEENIGGKLYKFDLAMTSIPKAQATKAKTDK
jgi:hypothetical protein